MIGAAEKPVHVFGHALIFQADDGFNPVFIEIQNPARKIIHTGMMLNKCQY
jgi:hypothetical protein